MPNVHSHIATAANHDWLEFWYVWWWIRLFILDIFVDCIEVGHSNRLNWCPIKRFGWNQRLVFRFSEQQLKRKLSNGCSNDTQCGAIIRQRRPQQTIANVSVVNTIQWKALLFSFIGFLLKLKHSTISRRTHTHSLTCTNRFQIAIIV